MNADINKPGTENIAGVKSIRFADIENVVSVENGVLKMKQGFSPKKLEITQGKYTYECDQDASGKFFDFKVQGILSGHEKNVLANIVLATDCDLILLVELDNITYICGNTEEGIHFKFGTFSGGKPGDDTGNKLEFWRKLRFHPEPLVNII